MTTTDTLYNQIVQDLESAGRESPYLADANEPDPRYLSYGVRAAGKKAIFASHRNSIRALAEAQQLQLAHRLIHSGYGEQQEIGLFILERHTTYFTPQRFDELDAYIRCLRGWSKVDSFAGSLVRDVLLAHPEQMLDLVRTWNQDNDMWLQRMSVVLFTRKVAKSGKFNDFALEMCANLVNSDEDLVRKGVGWSLKDLMRSDRERVLSYVCQLRQQGVSSTITLYAIRELKGQERAAFLSRCS